MDHVQSELSQRFAKSYATAAFGYAQAASAAYAALADQTLDFWSQAARAGSSVDDRQPRLQLVTGPRPYRSAFSATQSAASPASGVDFVRISQAWADSPMFAPVRAWWSMFPLQGNPACWPMAYAMMSAGVPRTVAMPAAEANIAAFDAASVASASIDRAFSAYRSESGFAVSQIVVSPKSSWIGALFLAPFATSIKLPWS
ncbi:MAG: hypothetical protein AB7S70_05115 [Hyphomicrobium sp.]|uniref:hypothetical protein n=1 Tax=Hyphomicrobium sp. TaxID=82 RepID=UPI003D0B9D79